MDLLVCAAAAAVVVVAEAGFAAAGIHIVLRYLAKQEHYSINHRSRHHLVYSHDYHRPS